MARKSGRAAVILTEENRAKLSGLATSRVAPAREVERAAVLLKYAEGVSITGIQRQLGVSRPMIYKCVDKALAAGVQQGLKDAYHRPHEPEITEAAKAWVVSLACAKPKDLGLAAELWSISALARYVSQHAEASGFSRLANAGKSTVWRILDENDLKPHKISYWRLCRALHNGQCRLLGEGTRPTAALEKTRQRPVMAGCRSRPCLGQCRQ